MYEGYKPIYVENKLNIMTTMNEGYKCWEAHCKSMDVSEYGATEKEARENLDDLIQNYFSAHYEYNKNLQELVEMENVVIEKIGNKLLIKELV